MNWAEGRWTTWSDQDDAPHIARLDVPGNEALEADFLAGRARRPTREELDRAIQWTAEHPEWLRQVESEWEDIFGGRYQDGTPEHPGGPRFYLDSHTGNIVQADSAASLGGASRDYWRLVVTEEEVEASLAEGEPAVTVPLGFELLPPMEQIDVVRQQIDRLYGEPTEDDPGGPFHRQILDLQQHWGVSPPVQGYQPLRPEEQPALPPRLPEYPERQPVRRTPPESLLRPSSEGQLQPASSPPPRHAPPPWFPPGIRIRPPAFGGGEVPYLPYLRPPQPPRPPATPPPNEVTPGVDRGIFLRGPARDPGAWRPRLEQEVPPANELPPDVLFPFRQLRPPPSPPWPALTLGPPTPGIAV